MMPSEAWVVRCPKADSLITDASAFFSRNVLRTSYHNHIFPGLQGLNPRRLPRVVGSRLQEEAESRPIPYPQVYEMGRDLRTALLHSSPGFLAYIHACKTLRHLENGVQFVVSAWRRVVQMKNTDARFRCPRICSTALSTLKIHHLFFLLSLGVGWDGMGWDGNGICSSLPGHLPVVGPPLSEAFFYRDQTPVRSRDEDSTSPCHTIMASRSLIRLLLVITALFLLILILILGPQELNPGLLFLRNLGYLRIPQLLDLLRRAGKLLDLACNLSAANQRRDDGGADDEGQDEAVDAVPRRSPAALGGTGVGVVEEVEDEELRDQGVFHWEQEGGPGEGGGEDTDGVAAVAVVAIVAAELKTPVDCAEEGEDLKTNMSVGGA
jgi:hypothetical protein